MFSDTLASLFVPMGIEGGATAPDYLGEPGETAMRRWRMRGVGGDMLMRGVGGAAQLFSQCKSDEVSLPTALLPAAAVCGLVGGPWLNVQADSLQGERGDHT